MARSDLILTLVKAGSRGDQLLFRRAAEALIAEEEAKQHHLLARKVDGGIAIEFQLEFKRARYSRGQADQSSSGCYSTSNS